MSSQFNSFPEDVLRLILTFSVPSAIRSCQLACRLLRNIVKSDVCIRYLLELDACGHVEPANPRWDLTFAQKLEMVRNHRSRWEHPEKVTPTIFELHIGEGGATYEFAGGVYARGIRSMQNPFSAPRRLNFYQLPSPNKGTDYKHWVISDLGLDARDFGMDPEQDLLVLLEAERGRQHGGIYRIHLRTMSTNQSHPKTSVGQSILVHQHPLGLPPAATFYFEISGHLLAVLFRSISQQVQSYVVIWDWTTGLELARAHTVGGNDASFTLLSDDLFVLSRFSESYEAARHIPNDTYGFLDVYRFNSHKTTSPLAPRIASFALPLLDHQNVQTSIRIRCAPTGVTPISESNIASLSKVFDLSPSNRLLCLEIYLTPIFGVRPTKSAGTLYVPSSLIMSSIAKRQHMTSRQPTSIIVPWADWAEKTSWVDTSTIRSNNECFIFGQRMAGFEAVSGGLRRKIVMLDFDQRRLRSRGMLRAPVGGLVRSPGGTAEKSDRYEQVGEQVFCAGITRASRKYVEATLLLKEPVGLSDQVMVGDEHVVVKKNLRGGGQSLVVYTF
ncbi:hypothetical protein BDV93DRAFT_542163 [Ceratobasidium sp. AG-I]|nr:hypothetical protein BDV93DRAFT_542163 [Ceratobasidium sp. AG-I]